MRKQKKLTVEFIPITLDDFEKQFNTPDKRDSSKRAFELFRPEGQEAYYECKLSTSDVGSLLIKVYTSIRSDRRKARNVGEDAIRIILGWEDDDGWFRCINKGKRVYRSGGAGSTADDVIKRALDRAREMVRDVMGPNSEIRKCPRCSRPMTLKEGKFGNFYGCIGYFKNRACEYTLKE